MDEIEEKKLEQEAEMAEYEDSDTDDDFQTWQIKKYVDEKIQDDWEIKKYVDEKIRGVYIAIISGVITLVVILFMFR